MAGPYAARVRAPRHTSVAEQDASIAALLSAAEQRVACSRGRLRQFRRAIAECGIPILAVDNERWYTEANTSARLLFRMSLSELRDTRIEDLTAPEYMTVLQDAWGRLMGDGRFAGPYEVGFFDGSRLRVVYRALANVLPGQHLIVFAPSEWPQEELALLHDPDPRPTVAPLTGREREVLTLIATGADVLQISTELTISPATVKSHLRNIHRKLGTRNRAHAVGLASQLGLISPTLVGS